MTNKAKNLFKLDVKLQTANLIEHVRGLMNRTVRQSGHLLPRIFYSRNQRKGISRWWLCEKFRK